MEREAKRERWCRTAHIRRDLRLVMGCREVESVEELNLIEVLEATGTRDLSGAIDGDITALKCLVRNG